MIAALIAAPWVAWAVVRGLGLDGGHPLVAAMAFTPYAAMTAVVPVLIAVALRRRVVAAAAAIAAVVLGLAVAPRAFDGPARASDGERGPSLTVMTLNLYRGRADAEEVMRLVRAHGVDVLALQELTPEAVERLDAAGARTLFRGRLLEPRNDASGSGLLARRELRETRVPTRAGGARQPEAVVDVLAGPALRIKTVHPRPPTSSWAEADWRRSLRALPGPREGGTPRILAGDFNGTLDHREMRRLLDRGYVDAADAAGAGLRTTWPVRTKRRLQLAIDHVLLPPGVKVRRVDVRDAKGSDHRAVIAELQLPAR